MDVISASHTVQPDPKCLKKAACTKTDLNSIQYAIYN